MNWTEQNTIIITQSEILDSLHLHIHIILTWIWQPVSNQVSKWKDYRWIDDLPPHIMPQTERGGGEPTGVHRNFLSEESVENRWNRPANVYVAPSRPSGPFLVGCPFESMKKINRNDFTQSNTCNTQSKHTLHIYFPSLIFIFLFFFPTHCVHIYWFKIHL